MQTLWSQAMINANHQNQNRTPLAVITGASSGIGAATAMLLAQKGYELVLLARRWERLNSLKAEIIKNLSSHGANSEAVSEVAHKIHLFAVDVSHPIQVDLFLGENKDLLSHSSVLVNSAGLAKGVDKIQDSFRNDFEEMIDTNIKGLFYLTRGLLPSMIKNNQGNIINIGSVAGRWVYPGGGVYCATKFAVRALTEGIRMDLLGTALRVTNIEPGMVETEFSLVRFQNPDKAAKIYEGMTPLTPMDIAETIEWCLHRPAHVNIQELVIFPTQQAAVGQVHRA